MDAARKDADGRVWLQLRHNQVCIHVQGRATQVHGEPLREFSAQLASRGFGSFRLDLSECTWLDSAFIGALAGLSLDLDEAGHPKLAILRAAPDLRAVLETHGVESFFQFDHHLYPLGHERFEVPPTPDPLAPEALNFTDLFDFVATPGKTPVSDRQGSRRWIGATRF